MIKINESFKLFLLPTVIEISEEFQTFIGEHHRTLLSAIRHEEAMLVPTLHVSSCCMGFSE